MKETLFHKCPRTRCESLVTTPYGQNARVCVMCALRERVRGDGPELVEDLALDALCKYGVTI